MPDFNHSNQHQIWQIKSQDNIKSMLLEVTEFVMGFFLSLNNIKV